MITLLSSVFVFAILILFHELGHFLIAKKVGIRVHEFSLGFGPMLIRRQVGETAYSLRLFPLGGFVRMAGMESGDQEDERGFNRKPVWQRMGVIFAGPVMNFVLALLLFVFTFTVIGIPSPSNSNLIGGGLKDQPAARAGLKAGDRVVGVDGKPVSNWNDMADAIHANAGRAIKIAVLRDGRRLTLPVTPVYDSEQKKAMIGIKQVLVFERQTLAASVKLGVAEAVGLTVLVIKGLVMMVTGAVSSSDVAGPVGIMGMIGEAARGGLAYLLNFAAILSINLGLINLLPIPALDGSRLVFLGLEKLRGRPVEQEKENFIHLVGFALLMLLILVITYNDILRIVVG